MKLSFAATISSDCVSFTGVTGKNHIISLSHPNNTRIRDAIREIGAAKKINDEIAVDRLWNELETLADVPAFIQNASGGKVKVKDGVVYYGDEALHSTLAMRILWGLSEGFNMDPYIAFLENLMENPSKRAVDELYGFMEACNMGITDDGHLIAYKRVRGDYKDCHSGRFDNSVGRILEMPRNKVDEDKDRTCSYGFHFCSQAYLPHFGNYSGHRVVIVKVNPRDVVAIPADYANAKARCARYEVIGEYEGADLNDILSHKPVWGSSDINREFRPDDDFEDRFDEDEEFDEEFDEDRANHNFDEDEDEEDIPEDITDQSQFASLTPMREEIDEVAVTKTKDGKVKASFSFEDGLSEYDLTVEIGPDGQAIAKINEKPIAPNREFTENDQGDGC